MCPQNMNDELYDGQYYDSSSYQYGDPGKTDYSWDDDNSYDDTCTDAGKWNCCNPHEKLLGLKAWVKNCEVSLCTP